MARGALQTEDLVQDTLTHVLGHLTAFNPRHEGAFQGYVRTALWNRIRDIARRKSGEDHVTRSIPESWHRRHHRSTWPSGRRRSSDTTGRSSG